MGFACAEATSGPPTEWRALGVFKAGTVARKIILGRAGRFGYNNAWNRQARPRFRGIGHTFRGFNYQGVEWAKVGSGGMAPSSCPGSDVIALSPLRGGSLPPGGARDHAVEL